MRDETLTCANYKVEAAWCLRNNHRLIWSLPLTAGLMLVIAVLLLRGNTEDPKANYARSLRTLMAFVPPPVPKSENANEDYKLAGKAYVAYAGTSIDNPLWLTDGDSKVFEDAAVLAFWSANTKAIGHLLAGAQKERCDWGVDVTVVPWRPINVFESLERAELLALDARCRAHKGDHQGAAASLSAIRRLSRHIETAPCTYEWTISTGVEGIGCETLKAILAWDTPTSPSDLAAYRNAIGPRDEPYERCARNVEREAAHALCLLDGVVSGTIVPPKTSWPPTYSISPLCYGSDRKCLEAVAKETIDALHRRQQPEPLQTLVDRLQTGPAPFSDAALSQTHYFRGVLNVSELALLNDVALSYLQFRVKFGHNPESVANLVPEFLPAVPTGPANNKPVCCDVIEPKSGQECAFQIHLASKQAVRISIAGPSPDDYRAIVLFPVLPVAKANQEHR